MTTSDPTPEYDPYLRPVTTTPPPEAGPAPTASPPVELPPHFANYDPGRYARRRREFEEEEAQYDLATYQMRGPDPYSVRSSDYGDQPPVSPYPTRQQARKEQRRGDRSTASAPLRPAGQLFLGGVAVTFVAAVMTIKATSADSNGGVIWTGGFVVGILLFVRSFKAYREATRSGARMPPAAWGGVALGAAVVLAVGGAAAASSIADGVATPGADEPGVDAVGSCWHEAEGDQLFNVSCGSDRADYRASREVNDPAACGEALYIDGRKGFYLCLTPVATP